MNFSYTPPGELHPKQAGRGLVETRALAADMRFPIEKAPAFANSQVWGNGGYLKNQGAECDAANFQYPWHDNYCEDREWDMPLCPAGIGHQGQDIRAASCKNLEHWTVATVDGTIISASGPGTGTPGYQVILAGADGTRYRYLHMGAVQVSVGQKVTRGQQIAKVSREFNGTPTTVHLHFDIMQNVSPHGMVWVSPYMSLVRSYERLLGIAQPEAGVDAGVDAGATEPPSKPKADETPAQAEPGDTEEETIGAPQEGSCAIALVSGASASAEISFVLSLVVVVASWLRRRTSLRPGGRLPPGAPSIACGSRGAHRARLPRDF